MAQNVSQQPSSSRLAESKWRKWQTPVAFLLLLAACWLLLQVLLLPDPQGNLLWQRAQRLERDGLVTQALRNYKLLADMHPESRHAPDALWRQAEIHTELARAEPEQAGAPKHFREAIAAYVRLADGYTRSPLAGQALLRTGALLGGEFRDFKAARGVYERVLLEYPNNRDYAAQATVQLGRIAIDLRDGKTAQSRLQAVLRRYPALTERCAEAQYLLGLAYETLFAGKDHDEMARNAYHTTIKKYPQSLWAGKARERLGLLNYDDLAPIERRVLLGVSPLPDEGPSGGSLLNALRLVLAARGMEAGDTMLRGWGGEPFYAGYSPGQPSRAVSAPFDSFKTAVAVAGLRYDTRQPDAKTALRDLQREIDDARATLVYAGRWQLVAGYDNARNQVFLQNGAQQTTLPADAFAALWKRGAAPGAAPGAASGASPVAGFTLLSFHAPGETANFRLVPTASAGTSGTITGEATAGEATAGEATAGGTTGSTVRARNAARTAQKAPAQVTPLNSLLTTPTFLLQLKPLDERAAHRRAIRRAVELMRRPGDGRVVLNLEALRALSAEMRRLSVAPVSEGATEASDATVSDLSVPPVRAEDPSAGSPGDAAPGATTAGASPGDTAAAGTAPQAAPPDSSSSGDAATARRATDGAATRLASGIAPTDAPERARALLGWRGAPLQRWIASRRQAAAYLDLAASRVGQSSLRRAAADFRRSVDALQNAAVALPAARALGGATLSESARRAFAAAAREVERALQAESRAVEAMSKIG